VKTKLKAVLIGCGTIAREHLVALAQLNNVSVEAVCDLSPARAEATAERYGISRWYSSSERLLADIRPDLVHITSSPSSHFPLSEGCLSRGLNVLCEKPIAVDYQQFVALKQLALQNKCLLLENQNLRFHSSVQKIQNLITSGRLGDVLEVQIFVALNIVGKGSPYIDRNAPHFSLDLRGGVVGDFLPHISYLAHLFIGSPVKFKTIWKKQNADLPIPADEFRGVVIGESATGYVGFSGNAQPNGFWLRVIGSRMYAEANLFESPRIALRRYRSGDQAIMTLIDGLSEARDIMKGSVMSFWRKLGGRSSYDGLAEFIDQTYRSIELGIPPPVSLDEIDASVQLADHLTRPENSL
jgi:predicted dehydrogenase